MIKIEKVIFDLGKVIVKFDPRNLYNKIFDNPEDTDFFLKIYVHGNGIFNKI